MRVTEMMNCSLLEDFSEEESNKAVMQFHLLKAPGPDGFPTLFFQKFWNIVGHDVSSEILNILRIGVMPHLMSHTFLTLIPKVKSLSKVSEFWPINLCNVSYKIISKMLSNRLKLFLASIILKSQSAFIPGDLL